MQKINKRKVEQKKANVTFSIPQRRHRASVPLLRPGSSAGLRVSQLAGQRPRQRE